MRLRPGALGLSPALAAKRPRFTRPLRIPRVITDAQIQIPIRPAKVAVRKGEKTKMWTYDGTFPGPTIRRPAGEETQVTFLHNLPAKAGELTVHLHGGHNTSADDGQPGGLTAGHPRSLYCDISKRLSPRESGNDLLIAPGAARTYTYSGTEDGGPERAATQWYHDHRLDTTARNVWRGLAGIWITDDDFDASLPLPRGTRDLPLMIVDRGFDKHNQLTDPFGAGAHAPNDGVVGKTVLVNGVERPFHKVSATRYRLRILNAANFQFFNLQLGDGAKLVQIATESGLMPRPVKRRQALIGPAERVELIVDFSRFAGKRVVLRSVGQDAPFKSLGSKTFDGPLMEFRVGKKKPDTTSVPAELRPLPDWVAGASKTPQHTWEVTISKGLPPVWLINGKTFDPASVDTTVLLGSTVTWELSNRTAVAHMMHLHATDWYLLSRDGKPPPPWEDCLKETFLVGPGERIVVAGHFTENPGKFVVHCHMLDHEDHGLMSQFEVLGLGA